MITQQAKDHAQACLDATKEAARHSHMCGPERAAYMTLLANFTEARPVPIPRPPQNRHLSDNDEGYKPAKGSAWMVWALAASLVIVPIAVALVMGVTPWQN